MCEQRLLMNSFRVVYANEESILSQRVCKFSENVKDKRDTYFIMFSEGYSFNKRPRGLDDLLELKTQYTRMF